MDRQQVAESMFHKEWLSHIKKTLGSKCTFIAHLKTMANTFLKLI